MKLGLSMGYVVGDNVHDDVALAQEADRLGYSVAWAAEAYGSDAPTVLSFVAATTRQIDVGSAVMQIPARTPAMTAMTAATLDLLSGGRFRLGLGVSGPQVSEGWHGVRFDKPLARTREYVEIVDLAMTRRAVHHDGEFFTLPLPDGPGKALKLTVHPARDHIPVYLAAIGPKNLELSGEIADGWLAVFFSPAHAADSMAAIRAGQDNAGRTGRPFDVAATVPVSIGADIEACADPIRGYAALYVGGMGSREQNFYNQLACRMGFEAEAKRVQDLFLDRRQRDAMAAVPLDFIDQTSLIGPRSRVAERLHAFADAGVTTLNVSPVGSGLETRITVIRQVCEALALAGLAD
ncbi:MAG: LLM class F420-dependent oxidoreductase [Propionibacteriales bacterium]|nr:LLM class F420-dependent oxidoreductase [Propionibacteriales bacterium]